MERKTALITDNKSFNADAPNIGVPFNLSGREQKVLMKISNCYNCRSDSRSFYAKENGFSIVKCSDCGLLYLEEHPDNLEISEAHKQGKHTGQRILDVTGVFSDRSISLYLNILDDIFRGNLHEQAKWLDVGCGHGEFIAAIQKYTGGKVSARGTEPNIHKQKSARKRGLHVSYFDLESHEEKYDYISMLNVYSHLPDPPSFLTSLKKNLKPGGELIIETGDTANFPAKDHYRPFYLPDHLSFANEEIVVNILERIGFDIVSINKYPYPNLPSLDPKSIIKEIIKAFLPRHKTKIKRYFKYYKDWKLYSQTDMYIRARLKS